MKQILFCLGVIFLASCQPKNLPTQVSVGQSSGYLRLSHESTKEEMEKAKTDFEKVGVVVDYGKTTFFDNGKLRNLELTVALPNGNVGTCASDIVGLQYQYFGFRYDLNGEEVFQVGSQESNTNK